MAQAAADKVGANIILIELFFVWDHFLMVAVESQCILEDLRLRFKGLQMMWDHNRFAFGRRALQLLDGDLKSLFDALPVDKMQDVFLVHGPQTSIVRLHVVCDERFEPVDVRLTVRWRNK